MIILASQSPRRQEILEELGISFQIVPSRYEEDNARDMAPEELVRVQAEGKALEVFQRTGSGAAVLGADTIVVLDGNVLGKPKDASDAERMLKALSGRTHQVMTGVAVVGRERMRSDVCMTEVQFRRLSEEEIRSYIATGEPMDKAGAYAIQGIGGAFVKAVNGSRSNVIGLPKELTRRLLDEIEEIR